MNRPALENGDCAKARVYHPKSLWELSWKLENAQLGLDVLSLIVCVCVSWAFIVLKKRFPLPKKR